MSYHLEWATTADTAIALYRRGQEFTGYDEAISAQYRLLFAGGGGGGLIIESTKQQLYALSTRNHGPGHPGRTAAEPLTDP